MYQNRKNHLSVKAPKLSAREQNIVFGPPGLLLFGVLVSLLAGGITMLGTW